MKCMKYNSSSSTRYMLMLTRCIVSFLKTKKAWHMNILTGEDDGRKGKRELYHTRPSVDGLMPETITLLSPTCCFDFLLESLPSNFCDQNKVGNQEDTQKKRKLKNQGKRKEQTFLVAQNSSSVRTLLSTSCLCNLCNSLNIMHACYHSYETTKLLTPEVTDNIRIFSKKLETQLQFCNTELLSR